ncbi:MAG: hypothetical protein HYW89_04660 [Candidatus Sungiibacteriota bacterium]|uniref:Uncharacterized protein n=1 Tax=Candidatus Sungiibacteriota bacterium TaxID=2750080 RepID=A0A7T5RJI8_9BACT|nr:MAG: hypothetical protein HYW89_04660 [Candidatus Sungbacteria bacterium]
MKYLLNVFLVHLGIGLGFSLASIFFFKYRHKRRPIFRFGGNDPFSWGDKNKWLLWWIIAYGIANGFEVVTGFRLNMSLYLELALLALGATAFTLGLFLMDRMAMIFFEPESHWKPKSEERPVSRVVEEKKAEVVAEPQELKQVEVVLTEKLPEPIAAPEEDKSWFSKNVGRAAESVSSSSDSLLRKVGKSVGSGLGGIKSGFSEVFAERRKTREDRRRAEEEKRQEIREKFEKLTRSRRPS